jgi:hypothetical protein
MAGELKGEELSLRDSAANSQDYLKYARRPQLKSGLRFGCNDV